MNYTRQQVKKIFAGKLQDWELDIIMVEPKYFISNTDITGKVVKNRVPNLLLGFGLGIGQGWGPILKTVVEWVKHREDNYDSDMRYKAEWERTNKTDCPGYKRVSEVAAKYPRGNPYHDFKFDQIKEKFGGLRIYSGPATNEFFGIAGFAEMLSYHICHDCGKPGRLRDEKDGFSWYLTLCDACAVSHRNEKARRVMKR